jgi:hypothetical protein
MSKQIINWQDLEIGKTYNRVYIGPNKAYAERNGKTTFRVVSKTTNELRTRDLFDPHPMVLDPELKHNEIRYSAPENFIGTQYVVTECDDPTKWFIKSQVMTVQTALQSGAVKLDTLKKHFTACAGCQPIMSYNFGEHFYFNLEAQPTEQFPYLETVYFIYEKMDALKADVKFAFPGAWFDGY